MGEHDAISDRLLGSWFPSLLFHAYSGRGACGGGMPSYLLLIFVAHTVRALQLFIAYYIIDHQVPL